jgi:ABC-type multidrug transport system fused ATPase/permease subunit
MSKKKYSEILISGLGRKYQLEQMKAKDKRVKLMNEILGGVKVLKLYGWEPSFMKQVLDIRDTEISVLKKAAYLNAFLSFFWTSIPFCVALASFATYVLTDPNNVLTAEKGWFTLGTVHKGRWQLEGGGV